MVDFETTVEKWPSEATKLYQIYDRWNAKWQYQTTVDNLMAMVVSEEAVPKTSVMLARVVADPPALMNSNYQTVVAMNNGLDLDDIVYDTNNKTLGPSGARFALDYSDLGDVLYISALGSVWKRKFTPIPNP